MKIKRFNDYCGYDTSFSGICFSASVEQIVEKLGKPNYADPSWENGDKTTREWYDLGLEDGTPFTIYDWKEYRAFGDKEVIEWHVGTPCQINDRMSQDKKVEMALTEIGLIK